MQKYPDNMIDVIREKPSARSVQTGRLVMGLMLVGIAPLACWHSPIWLLAALGIGLILIFRQS
jgi:hypothetical protein